MQEKRGTLIKVVIILIIVSVGLGTNRFWLPYLLSFALVNQNEIGALDKLLGLIFNVLGGLSSLVLLVLLLLTRPKEKNNQIDQPLLKLTSPDKILADYVSTIHTGIKWIDREIVSPRDLPKHKGILLVGRMKSGKSWEAAELIRKGINEGIILPSRVYDITHRVRTIDKEFLRAAIKHELDSGSGALFYVNDLPKQAEGKQLETLSEFLKQLEQCSPGYFLATARSDHYKSNPALQKWLIEHEIKVIEMKNFSQKETAKLLNNALKVESVDLKPEFKQIIVEKSDGTPYHTMMVVKRLVSEDVTEIQRNVVERIAAKSLEDIWIEIRSEINKQEPTAQHLLQALTIFYNANIPANIRIVDALVKRIIKEQGNHFFQFNIKNKIRQAVILLNPFGIEQQKKEYIFPDIAIYPTEPTGNELQIIKNLIFGYRRMYRNRFFRRNNLITEEEQGVLIKLGINFYNKDELQNSYETFQQATENKPHDVEAWCNLAVTLNLLNRKNESERVIRHALTLNPDIPELWVNLGAVLDDLDQREEAENALLKAISLDPYLDQAWFNLGILYETLDRINEAEKAYLKAISIEPALSEGWDNLGQLYRQQNRVTDAINSFGKAIEIKPEKATSHAGLAALYRELGEQGKSAFHLNRAQELSEKESIYNRACISAISRDWDQAFLLLETALSNQEIYPDWVHKDPDWDEAHDDPRYLEILEQYLK